MVIRALVPLLVALAAVVPGSRPGAEPVRDPPRRADFGSLPFFYDLYTFRGDRGGTTVVAAFAVAAGELEAEERDGEVRYRFDVTLVLADTVVRSVSRTDDSVFVAAPRALAREHLLYTHIEVQAPPSGSTVQRVVMTDATTPGRGQLYDSFFPIPDYGGSELMLSDIALGEPRAGAGWSRGDVRLALLPTSQFPASSFDVYYEIYNLPYRSRYATEIAVQPVPASAGGDSGRDEAVRLRFSGESSAGRDGTIQELRHVEANLAPGTYRLTVTITNEETGATVKGSRHFEVRGWAPGATMVAALPRTRRSER